MDTRDLDRMVTKTELNPFVKMALRRVRKAIEEGNVTGFTTSNRSWSVRVADSAGGTSRSRLRTEPCGSYRRR